MNYKLAIGLVLGIAIGFGCRVAGLPVPAPAALVGALLVVAMTSGYALADRFLARRQAHQADHCGGPSGLPPSHSRRGR